MLPRLWKNFIRPILIRPPQYQVAALCYRRAEAGVQVLLITSRETKRWILPKGWPMPGRNTAQAALQEAWEEAGVLPAPSPALMIGQYSYPKVTGGGLPVDTRVDVHAIEVDSLAEDFPEREQRSRAWLSPAEAAKRVQEDDLASLLRDFERRVHWPAPLETNHSNA